ncbi:MAG: hypothetical protein SWI22_07675 [Pseudomonadota bacterium]|nr:hypothetical protein [Pseudomonadota bacterium]
MRAAVGLAWIALLAGCMAVETPTASSTLRFSPALAEGFDALPRVVGETPQARAVNAALDRIDVGDREERASCLEMKRHNDNVEWGRSVEAPMIGPRFVSLVVNRGSYCGGAHPWWSRTPLVFDLETGRPINWTDWLPPEMATPIHAEDPDLGSGPPVLDSPALKAWFAARVLAEMTEYGRRECAELYAEDQRESWGLTAWPDARAGGLTLQSAGLVHADMGCHAEVVMPLDELKRRGGGRDLIEAIGSGRRDRLWRNAPPEPERTAAR